MLGFYRDVKHRIVRYGRESIDVRKTRLWPFFSKPDARQNGSQMKALLKGV